MFGGLNKEYNMMYALIKNNKVVNQILADEDFVATISHEYDYVIQTDELVTGFSYNHSTGVFTTNVVTSEPENIPVVIDTTWFIDRGPFYDRFGSVKMAILTSQDIGIKAILEDIKIRAWIDLKNTIVSDALQYIHSVIPALTQELISQILTTPVSATENMALKKLYF